MREPAGQAPCPCRCRGDGQASGRGGEPPQVGRDDTGRHAADRYSREGQAKVVSDAGTTAAEEADRVQTRQMRGDVLETTASSHHGRTSLCCLQPLSRWRSDSQSQLSVCTSLRTSPASLQRPRSVACCRRLLHIMRSSRSLRAFATPFASPSAFCSSLSGSSPSRRTRSATSLSHRTAATQASSRLALSPAFLSSCAVQSHSAARSLSVSAFPLAPARPVSGSLCFSSRPATFTAFSLASLLSPAHMTAAESVISSSSSSSSSSQPSTQRRSVRPAPSKGDAGSHPQTVADSVWLTRCVLLLSLSLIRSARAVGLWWAGWTASVCCWRMTTTVGEQCRADTVHGSSSSRV